MFDNLKKLLVVIHVLGALISCKKSDTSTPLSSEKTILSVIFKSSDNPGISSDVTASISFDSIHIEFPAGISLASLVPTINFSGKRINPANKTAQDFTKPVTYIVTAEDGTTRTYTFSARLELSDTASLLLGKWYVIKDSISSVNFAFSNGDIPISGVINGTTQDYYEFYSNQTLYISENHITGISHYQFLPNNQMYFDVWALMGNATVLVLTSTKASFSWSKTNSFGGHYFRRVDLKR
jgi:hypothetical protein